MASYRICDICEQRAVTVDRTRVNTREGRSLVVSIRIEQLLGGDGDPQSLDVCAGCLVGIVTQAVHRKG